MEEFELGKMPAYITSSKDEVLSALAKKEGKQFVGSTSSTVAVLCQVSTEELGKEWSCS